MTTVKVECGCGQRYAFDVEPLHGRMPAPVACPSCGFDGTAQANLILAQLPSDAAYASEPALVVPPAPAAAPPRLALATPVPASPPPISQAPPPLAGRPVPGMPVRPPPLKPVRGKDGWNSPETTLNKVGQYIAFTPACLASLAAWKFLSITPIIVFLACVVAVFGIIGGILNVFRRGPVWAGAIVGSITSVAGFLAASWWISFRNGDAWVFEAVIAFVIGCMPGFIVQHLLQKLVRRGTG